MKRRAMHHCTLGYAVPDDAIMVSGPVVGYGCDTAERTAARGGTVEATPFPGFVTCTLCLARLSTVRPS